LRLLEKLLLLTVFLAFAALTAWLERRPETPMAEEQSEGRRDNDPDYYMENFVATGLDSQGRQYIMEGVRMLHFPIDDTSLVEQPHIIQYTEEAGPRHVYAETGLISADGTEVLLRGNVKVIESRSENQPGNVTTTERMRVKLKDKPG
jgi:lipopolysaccharide export system protein LptC